MLVWKIFNCKIFSLQINVCWKPFSVCKVLEVFARLANEQVNEWLIPTCSLVITTVPADFKKEWGSDYKFKTMLVFGFNDDK